MRMLLFFISITTASASAVRADGSIKYAPPDLPAACALLSNVPADTTSPIPELNARISTASCLAETRFNALTLAPDDASVAALTTAAAPVLAMLDSAIHDGDPATAVIARRIRAELFVSMAVRMRSSIAPITMQTVGPPLVELNRQHTELEPKIQPWLTQH